VKTFCKRHKPAGNIEGHLGPQRGLSKTFSKPPFKICAGDYWLLDLALSCTSVRTICMQMPHPWQQCFASEVECQRNAQQRHAAHASGVRAVAWGFMAGIVLLFAGESRPVASEGLPAASPGASAELAEVALISPVNRVSTSPFFLF
jgi:hypothetical protein